MFERILYPTDFSDVSMKAVRYVKQLKDAGAKEAIVLHVIDERSLVLTSHEIAIDFAAIENELRKAADERGNKILEELRERGLEARLKIVKGNPFKTILKTAQEEDVSLIVIGSHGRSNVEEMLLGSVSEAVIRKAVRPVLVVKR
ncbi:MAG: Universal stress protein [Syntrophus sp. PtaU1.Bin005]|uniref:universal stress protein n=1 Tax=Syntrophus TaxID=43773 RepID=UPI0009CA8D76|nr:MAG: Universal stress protein [Syntrophus sp. PtaB.Bin138]OPY83646.1 MAG: Universal stress protein [Syntrophus sp. PtaU1.Bin005]